MTQKPTLPHGYLGPQGKFEDLGMSTVTHMGFDFRCHECTLKITFKITEPTKVTANLIDACNDKEYRENILVQTLNKLVNLDIHFPHAGFFKLQIYAIQANSKETSIPNVFNYMIQCTKGSDREVATFPKQYAQWKDGCYLFHPFCLKGVDSGNIKVIVPGAKAVALVVNDKWYPLAQRDRQKDDASDAPIPWSTNITDLLAARGTADRAVLTANYPDDDETKYTSLLEYKLA